MSLYKPDEKILQLIALSTDNATSSLCSDGWCHNSVTLKTEL